MARFFHSFHLSFMRKTSHCFLAFSWLLGLGAGGLIYRSSGESLSSLMLLAATGQMSIVSLFLRTSLSFLISAFAVYFSKPRFLFAVSFLRAFLYGYVVCGVFGAYETCGWLIRWLLLFSDTFVCVLLYVYISRHITGLRGFSFRSLLCCELLLGLLISIDFYVVSPFLRQILS